MKVLLIAILLSFSPLVHAQAGLDTDTGLRDTADRAIRTGEANAKDHSNQADDDDRQADKWKKQAQEHPEANGQPNHEMMEKSHHDHHLARLERMQAREFAREALSALATRNAASLPGSAPPKGNDGQPIDVQALQRIANVPATTEDSTASTPLTTGVAAYQGGDTSGLPVQPLNAAADTTTTTGTPAVKPSALNTASLSKTGPVQYGQSGNLAAIRNPIGIENGSDGGSSLKAQSAAAVSPNEHIVTAADGVTDQKTLEANRARILKQMGMRAPASVASVEETGPIRAKSDDIFAVVHTHYQTLSDTGTFYDGDAALPPTPGPSRNPPKFSKGF